MQNTTPFYKSRTFWVNAVALLSLVFPACRDFFESNPIEAGSALAALNVLLKFVTLGKHEIVDDSDTPSNPNSNSGGSSALMLFLLMSISLLTSCGHDVMASQGHLEVSKDGAQLIIDQEAGTLSYRQSAPAPTADRPVIINLPTAK